MDLPHTHTHLDHYQEWSLNSPGIRLTVATFTIGGTPYTVSQHQWKSFREYTLATPHTQRSGLNITQLDYILTGLIDSVRLTQPLD